jgi:hypothetical protein
MGVRGGEGENAIVVEKAGVYAVKGRKEAPKKTPTQKIEMLSQTRKFIAEPPSYSCSTVIQPEQTERIKNWARGQMNASPCPGLYPRPAHEPGKGT